LRIRIPNGVHGSSCIPPWPKSYTNRIAMQMPSNQPTLLDGKQQSKLSTIRSCLSISKLHPGRTAIKSRWVF
jgi:hypothetical protein